MTYSSVMDKRQASKLNEIISFIGDVRSKALAITTKDKKALRLFFDDLKAIPLLLTEGTDIRQEIKELILPSKIGGFHHDLRYIQEKSKTFGMNELSEISNAMARLALVLQSLSGQPNGSFATVFYSWQSDLPNRTNRGFIGDAISKAVRRISADEENTIECRADQDIQGIPGSPDIVNAILEKIDKSQVVVADVSIVTQADDLYLPNPNVMFELGYAIKSLTSDRVLMVFNEACGSVKNLPFDLGLKHQITYSAPEDQESLVDSKALLVKKLHSAITTILAKIT